MRLSGLLVMTLIGGAFALALTGCPRHHAHYVSEPPVTYAHHVHGADCGHHYWHDRWHSAAHPTPCDDGLCDVNGQSAQLPPAPRAADPDAYPAEAYPDQGSYDSNRESDRYSAPRQVYVERIEPPVYVESRTYYYHGGWYNAPHPLNCYHCRPRYVSHVHGSHCGHYHWHGAWYGYPHPLNCVRCRPAYTSVSVGVYGSSRWRSARYGPARCAPARGYRGRVVIGR